jgi:hypothetical protein
MTSIPIATKKLNQQLNTPQLLRGGWYLTWGVSLLLLIISIYGVSSQRQALKTVGKDAAPSILTAQQLQDSFADMDASLANELLLKPGDNQQPLADFEINRKKIADRLVAAAKNITYPKEEEIIKSLQWNNSAYLLKLQAARDAHERGDAAGALIIYQSAATLMDRDIIPQAMQLSLVNSQELEKTYAQQQFANGGIGLFIAIVGSGQIAILLTIQLFLYLRMRRILNLPLLGATAIALGFTVYTLSSFLSATANLRVAKEDAFNSIYALRQMRALSYKANGDESRYLFDRANAAQHEQSFNTKIKTILTIPPSNSNENILASLQIDFDTKSRLIQLTGVTGLFANSLNNITFAGERELAIATLKAFNEYLAIDQQIRALNRSGKVAEAIALCVGTNPGESNWAFGKYKKVQAELRELNQKEFDKNIKAGNDRLENFEIIAAIALSSVAILTLAGLRPRLIEYL